MARLSRGWQVVLAAMILTGVAHGVGVQVHAVWFAVLEQAHPWSRATLAVGTLVCHLTAAVTGVLLGRLLDRSGPGTLLFAGTVALACGSFVLGQTPLLLTVYVGFGLLGLGFAALGPVLVGRLVAPWFVGPARTQALTVASLGTHSGLVLVPLAMHLGLAQGPRRLSLMLGLLALTVVVPLLPTLTDTAPPLVPEAGAEPALTLAQAVRHPAYWALGVSLWLVVLAQAGFVAHAALIYGQHLGLMTGAWLWTLTSLCGLVARLALLVWRPWWTPGRLARAVYVLVGLGLAGLALAQQQGPLLWASVVPLGVGMPLTVTLEPLLAAQVCGTRTYGTLYGPIYAGTRVAAALGAVVYGLSVTWRGSYAPALWAMAGGVAVASGLIGAAVPLQASGAEMARHAEGET